MRKIKVKSLSDRSFLKYGISMNLLNNDEMRERSIFRQGFFADLISLDFGVETMPAISVCDVRKQERNIVKFLEAHAKTCEGILPLDDDVIIFAGIPNEPFSARDLEAFFVPCGTFVKLNPLIVHGTQFPVTKEEVHIVCMLPGRTFHNDMIAHELSEDDQAEIVL